MDLHQFTVSSAAKRHQVDLGYWPIGRTEALDLHSLAPNRFSNGGWQVVAEIEGVAPLFVMYVSQAALTEDETTVHKLADRVIEMAVRAGELPEEEYLLKIYSKKRTEARWRELNGVYYIAETVSSPSALLKRDITPAAAMGAAA